MAKKTPRKSKTRKPNQRKWYYDYQDQYTRIMQAYRREINRGYQLNPDFFLPVAPSKKERITKKDVERLARITPKTLRQNLLWVDPLTGEGVKGFDVVDYNKRTTRTKSIRKKLKLEELPEEQYMPSYADIAISSLQYTLGSFPLSEGARILEDWLDHVTAVYGKHKVAQMLDEGYAEGNIVTYNMVYKGGVEAYITNMMNKMPGFSDKDRAAMSEIMERAESWENPA